MRFVIIMTRKIYLQFQLEEENVFKMTKFSFENMKLTWWPR